MLDEAHRDLSVLGTRRSGPRPARRAEGDPAVCDRDRKRDLLARAQNDFRATVLRPPRRRQENRKATDDAPECARATPKTARPGPRSWGLRLWGPYHFRARIQSFQAFAAPFPGDAQWPVHCGSNPPERRLSDRESPAAPFPGADSIFSNPCGAISGRLAIGRVHRRWRPDRSASRRVVTVGALPCNSSGLPKIYNSVGLRRRGRRVALVPAKPLNPRKRPACHRTQNLGSICSPYLFEISGSARSGASISYCDRRVSRFRRGLFEGAPVGRLHADGERDAGANALRNGAELLELRERPVEMGELLRVRSETDVDLDMGDPEPVRLVAAGLASRRRGQLAGIALELADGEDENSSTGNSPPPRPESAPGTARRRRRAAAARRRPCRACSRRSRPGTCTSPGA